MWKRGKAKRRRAKIPDTTTCPKRKDWIFYFIFYIYKKIYFLSNLSKSDLFMPFSGEYLRDIFIFLFFEKKNYYTIYLL
jgi:hypothetical protein